MKSIGFLLILSLLMLFFTYDFEFKHSNISNSLFVPNMLVFLVSIGINLGAGNIFNPINYTLRKFINPKKIKESYGDYAGYIEEKKRDNKNVWFLSFATLTLLFVAYLFTII